jgi:hypothetical protein
MDSGDNRFQSTDIEGVFYDRERCIHFVEQERNSRMEITKAELDRLLDQHLQRIREQAIRLFQGPLERMRGSKAFDNAVVDLKETANKFRLRE